MMYDTRPLTNDITPTGIKIEGHYENDRNEVYRELYSDIIREAYGVRDVIIGHHLVYQTTEHLVDEKTGPYTHTFVQEIPSADALIFDHDVMRKLFGSRYLTAMSTLAMTPVERRDDLLSSMYYSREEKV
jgi:hypothetical protein